MARKRLTRAQQELLDSLSTTEWRKAPLLTRAATILSLVDRGLVKMRPVRSFGFYDRYADWALMKIEEKQA